MTSKPKQNSTPDKRIVVIQSGWVFIGNYHAATPKKPAHLTEASSIRNWGTTAGLGEIALRGPTPSTVLDHVGIMLIDNPISVLFTIACEV